MSPYRALALLSFTATALRRQIGRALPTNNDLVFPSRDFRWVFGGCGRNEKARHLFVQVAGSSVLPQLDSNQ